MNRLRSTEPSPPRPAAFPAQSPPAAVPPDHSDVWRPGRPVDLAATLGPFRRGGGDPTYRPEAGWIWRTTRTHAGPATVRLGVQRAAGAVVVQAWGPGAEHAVAEAPGLLGRDDDDSGFHPNHPLLREVAARHPGWRVPRSRRVLEALVPAVLEQLVTGLEARRAWRWLVLRYGDRAPGPAPAGMAVVPDAGTWARVPSWDWHRAGVSGRRAETVLRAAQVADGLERTVGLPHGEAERRLRSVPGVGVWTAAEVRQRAHGDPDALSVGDFHLCKAVGQALVGRPVDDEGMLELLQPWREHRYRVQRLVEMSGIAPERRGPRSSPRDFRRW